MSTEHIRELLDAGTGYVAFVDVLGYREIVESNNSDERKFRQLRSLFETLNDAFLTSDGDFNTNKALDDPNRVTAVAFSDSFYFSSKSLPHLLRFLDAKFANVYGYQELIYGGDPDSWTPFLRAAVVHGWAVTFRDPTSAPSNNPRSAFRNPVGPAVAAAYILAEKEGKLPGMRCVLPRNLLRAYKEIRFNPKSRHYEFDLEGSTIRLVEVPEPEKRDLDLVELAWPSRVFSSDNVSFTRQLNATRRQFNSPRAHPHFNATVNLFERSVAISTDPSVHLFWTKEKPAVIGDSVTADQTSG